MIQELARTLQNWSDRFYTLRFFLAGHPTPKRIVALVLDLTGPLETQALQQHCGGCDECRETLWTACLLVPNRNEAWVSEMWERLRAELEQLSDGEPVGDGPGLAAPSAAQG